MSSPPIVASDVAPPVGPPRPRRRWWRVSLRALMVAVLLVGGGLGWLARRAHLQRRGVAAITARGGRITYDWAMSDPKAGQRPRREPPGPTWLRRWLGDEFFQEVAYVRFPKPLAAEDLAVIAGFGHLRGLAVGDVSRVGDGLGRLAGIATLRTLQIGQVAGDGAGLTDAALAAVGRLTGLDYLTIARGEISDAGLDSLRDLARLETLSLIDCPKITSAGVARLLDRSPLLEKLDLPGAPVDDAIMPAVGRLRYLKALNLTQTGVTDAGIAHLAGATRLETLQIRQTAVGDAGLAHLAGLTALQRLIVGSTRIGDAGLAHLGRMVGLTELELTGTPITDLGLVHLAPLQKLTTLRAMTTAIGDAGTPALARLGGLRTLHLTKTKVTDAGLPPLAELKQLENLALLETAVTAQGEAELRRLLPALRVFQRGSYVRPVTARPVPVRPGGRGAAPAQPLRPEAGANRPDRPARPPAASTKGTAVGSSTEPQGGVLARLKDKHRPILVFAPAAGDSKLARQRNAWVGAQPEAGIKDRDITIIEVVAGGEAKVGDQPLTPDEVKELRRAFGVADDAFSVVLVGRDGGEKARWADPVSSQEVFGRIDAMPMREREVEQKGGH